ncbi:hypothetical protein BGZ99_009458 [Dissophora globulifera]|uniref:Uncharacterized protein n=1 Tax=Dissophora globulifera TaxID=979702 RepID=A0A9P6R6V7_9FUNG|nr:hypothetical protein BGZ99_009458 [Dissophora globulifera]
MGSFNTFYAFISNRVLPRSGNDDAEPSDKENYRWNNTHRRHYSDSMPKEAIQQLFPCEDRHSFNPHYQHNLHSTSPIYSTPSSLSTSPTNSSPSSTTSSASAHSLSRVPSTQKPRFQYTYSKRQQRHTQQLQQHQQYQQQRQQRQQHQHHSRSYSYNRHQGRRQSQRNQEHFEHMDDDLMVGYDNQQVYYGSGASTSMARVHPNGSPSYSFATSLSSAFDQSPNPNGIAAFRQLEQQVRPTSVSFSSFGASETERTSQSDALHAAASACIDPNNLLLQQQQPLLPSISEATGTMYLRDHDAVAVVNTDDAALGSRPVSSSSSSSWSPLSASSARTAPMTAKQSLMRIARCDPRQDNWCPAQAGQWTRHYASSRVSGIVTDGRRTRRL